MKVSAAFLIILTSLLMGMPTVVGAQESAAGNDSTEVLESNPLLIHFQTGLFARVAGDPLQHGDQKWLVTLDLSFSGYDRSHATWGLGMHAAIDEASGRFGPKFLWRIPLSKGGHGYFQIGPGLYIAGDGNIRWPSSFLEAELGYSNNIAVVAAVEHLTYGDPSDGYGVGYERTAGYVGLKLGQWPGLLATAGLLAVGAAAMASFANQGWN